MKRLFIVFALLLFVVSCGGDGDGSGTPITPPVNPPKKTGPKEDAGGPVAGFPDLLDEDGFPRLVPVRWSYLGQASDANNNPLGHRVYTDYNSITEDEITGYQLAWELWTYTEAQSRQDGDYPEVWTELLTINDCEKDRRSYKTVIGKDLTQKVLYRDDYTLDERGWTQVFSGTIGELLFDAVCDG